MYKKGDILICIFNQPLPGNDIAPALELKKEYTVNDIHLDSKGNQHLDVGLSCNVAYVKSYATGEFLPETTHWCHPNRFVKKQSN